MGIAVQANWSGFGSLVSSVIGFVPALAVSYLGHYFYSFRSGTSHRVAAFRFVSVATASFCFSLFVLGLLDTWIPHLSLVVSIAIIPVISYLVNSIWVFRN